MAQKSPRERYGDAIRDEVFGTDATGKRSATYIAELTGLNVETVRAWRRDAGRMPAYRYLQIKKALGI